MSARTGSGSCLLLLPDHSLFIHILEAFCTRSGATWNESWCRASENEMESTFAGEI